MSVLRAIGTFVWEQLLETPRWTPRSPTLLTGRTAIVTGANGGLGYEAAVHLARLDPERLILAVRNTSKGEAAKAELVKRSGLAADRVEVWPLDLASLESVKSFAARVDKLDRLDILLENAGVPFISWKETDDKWEQVLQVNAISTGLLGVLLLPLLARTATLPLEAGQKEFKPHLTIVGSEAHGFIAQVAAPGGGSLLADLNDEHGKNSKMRYGFTKLIDLFLARKIAALPAANGVVVNVVNPGLCVSGLAEQSTMSARAKAMMNALSRTTECGARNLAWAAVNDTPPGAYVSVTSVRASSGYSRSAEALKVESELWAELVEVWAAVEPKIETIVT